MFNAKNLFLYVLSFFLPFVLVAKEVPREKTVIVGSRGITAKEVWSPYLLGGNHQKGVSFFYEPLYFACLLYTSPSPRDGLLSRMPSSA